MLQEFKARNRKLSPQLPSAPILSRTYGGILLHLVWWSLMSMHQLVYPKDRGIGVIARDTCGMVLAALTQHLPGCASMFAILHCWNIQLLWDWVYFPSKDLSQAYDFFQALQSLWSSNPNLISIQYINRNVNTITHNLIHMGARISIHQVLFHDIPLSSLLSPILRDRSLIIQ